MSAHAKIFAQEPASIAVNSGDVRRAQLSFRYDDRYQRGETVGALHDEIESVVAETGLKTVAYDLDLQPSLLAHALAGRERHFMRLDWLPYFLSRASNDRMVELLAAVRGLAVRPYVALSAAERLARLEQELDRLGDVGELVRRKAGLK
jgi:hypothetical protein